MRRRLARWKGAVKQHPTIRRIFGKKPLTPRSRERRRTGRPEIPSGNVNPPPLRVDQPPIVLLVALGLEGPALSRLVGRIVLAQASIAFAPLFVVDHPEFEPLRRHGYLFEYIPSEQDWTHGSGRTDWDVFVVQRLSGLVDEYSPDTMLTVASDPDDHGGPTFETLLSGLLYHPTAK